MIQPVGSQHPEKLKQFLRRDLVRRRATERIARSENVGNYAVAPSEQTAALHARLAPRMLQHFVQNFSPDADGLALGHGHECTAGAMRESDGWNDGVAARMTPSGGNVHVARSRRDRAGREWARIVTGKPGQETANLVQIVLQRGKCGLRDR